MPTTLSPYLSFDGNTREAFSFYEKALGGRILAMLTYDDIPAQESPQPGCGGDLIPHGDGIMHGCLELPGGAMLMAGDVPPGMTFERMNGVMMALQFDTAVQAEAAFQALADGAQITMPLAPSFWAETFGMLTDRFGTSWGIGGGAIDFK